MIHNSNNNVTTQTDSELDYRRFASKELANDLGLEDPPIQDAEAVRALLELGIELLASGDTELDVRVRTYVNEVTGDSYSQPDVTATLDFYFTLMTELHKIGLA